MSYSMSSKVLWAMEFSYSELQAVNRSTYDKRKRCLERAMQSSGGSAEVLEKLLMRRARAIHQIRHHLEGHERRVAQLCHPCDGGRFHVFHGCVVLRHDAVVLGRVVQRIACGHHSQFALQRLRQRRRVVALSVTVAVHIKAGDGNASVVVCYMAPEEDIADRSSIRDEAAGSASADDQIRSQCINGCIGTYCCWGSSNLSRVMQLLQSCRNNDNFIYIVNAEFLVDTVSHHRYSAFANCKQNRSTN